MNGSQTNQKNMNFDRDEFSSSVTLPSLSKKNITRNDCFVPWKFQKIQPYVPFLIVFFGVSQLTASQVVNFNILGQ